MCRATLGAATLACCQSHSESSPLWQAKQARPGWMGEPVVLPLNKCRMVRLAPRSCENFVWSLSYFHYTAFLAQCQARTHPHNHPRFGVTVKLAPDYVRNRRRYPAVRDLHVARRQQARSWKLRVTMSLCRLWQKQARRQDACRALADICH